MPTYDPDYPNRAELSLNPAQAALARSHTYALLSRLYLQGMTADILPTLRAVPELALLLDEGTELEEEAAAHYHLFGYNLFPYESYFLSSAGQLGGPVTDAVLRFYDKIGYGVNAAAASPDHIGHELGLLAFLCRKEAMGRKANEPRETVRARALQWEFLETHLLQWLSPVLITMRRQPNLVFRGVADLTLGFIADHINSLRENRQTPTLQRELPSAPALLEDDQTGLRQIARHLVTPAHCGIFISRDDIADLGRQLELPRGFGSRQQVTLNLIRSAVQYGKLPDLLLAIEALLDTWLVGYEDISTAHPQLGRSVKDWRSRVHHTARISVQMRAQAPKTHGDRPVLV